MPRVLLLNDNIDQDNWGAQATPYAIRRMIEDEVADVEIDSILYAEMNSRYFVMRTRLLGSGYQEIGSSTRLRRLKYLFSREVEFFPELVDDFEYFGDQWDSGQGGPLAEDFIARAKNSDIVLFNAENGIYRNARTGIRGLFMAWYAKTRLKRVAGVINQTARVSDMDRPIMKGMVKFVYPQLDIVTARELRSFNDLKTAGISNVKWVPDVVFYLGENERTKLKGRVQSWMQDVGIMPEQPYFVLGASSLPMSRGRPGYASPAADLVREIQKREAVGVLVAKDRGCLFLEDVARETGAIYFGPEHEFHELWPLFAASQFLLTGHFHYAIMAAQVGCPFVAMSTNNHKMEGAMDDLDWYTKRTFDSTAIRYEMDDILREIDYVIANRQHLSETLKVSAAQLGEKSAATGKLVREALSRQEVTGK